MKCVKIIYRVILCFVSLVLFGACVDELDIETLANDVESSPLVIEAILIDEVIHQKVFLSRGSQRLDLETDTVYNPNIPPSSRPIDSVDTESGAMVRVLGDDGTEYAFVESEAGLYLSNQPFALEFGTSYTLEIVTRNGEEYVSDPVAVPGRSLMTNVYAERATNDNGEEGIAIYVDSEPQEGNTKFYRYTYEETYKIVSPLWSPYEFRLTDYDPCALPSPTYNLSVVPREVENRVCYNTVSSNSIVQLSTAGNPEGDISKQMVRFIGKDNFIISERYSILVQQQVQSADAFSFYANLDNFSQSENIFSQVQPGAIYANVFRKDGTNENVLGYVSAVGVSDQRLFLNFEDFFPGEERPEFPFNCSYQSPPESHPSYCSQNSGPNPCPLSVIERVDLGTISYFSAYDEVLVPLASCPGPFVVVPRICGDCTLLGSNVKPDFWID
ncbi:MAG: DUF4249 domain-containing protein [Flagellimonas sp.]